MRSQMASARIVSPIFSCQLRTLNWEQKMVEATLCRASMIHYTGRSTAAESLLNAAGHGAQFVRSRCSIWCGILNSMRIPKKSRFIISHLAAEVSSGEYVPLTI